MLEQCEEGGAAEIKHYKLTANPTPHPTAPLEWEEVEELGEKLNLGRREVWGKDLFPSFFCITLPSY